MTLFTPDGTSDTTDKKALLSTLMEWTTNGPIIAAMVRSGAADGEGLWQLAGHVRATVEEFERSKLVDGDEQPLDPQRTKAEVLDERGIAQALLCFLTAELRRPGAKWPAERVVDILAGYVSKTYGRRREAALTDLHHLAVELRDRHHIKRTEIPLFVILKGEAKELVREAMAAREIGAQLSVNEALAYTRTEAGEVVIPPDVVAAYQQDPAVLDDALVARLRALPESLKALAKRFPPDSMVRSDGDIICPALGYMAIVSGYDYEAESGQNVVLVAGSDDPEATTFNVHPDWLILVCCRGKVTQEAVEIALLEVTN